MSGSLYGYNAFGTPEPIDINATYEAVESVLAQSILADVSTDDDLQASDAKDIAGLLVGLIQPIDPLADVQTTIGATPRIDEKISTIITEILPSYVGEDHPTFVLFMKAFYEYLELEGSTRYNAVKLNTYRDIEQTLDRFVSHLKDEFAVGFPSQLESGMSKRQLIKVIRKYYEDKGGSLSARLLFRILFAKNATVRYPREQLFDLSSGDLTDVSSIRITSTSGITALTSVEGGLLSQRPSTYLGQPYNSVQPDAQAFIEKVSITKSDNLQHALLTIKDVSGSFIANREVELTKGSTLVKEVTHDIIYGITVDNAGSNFREGESIVVTDADGNIIATSRVEFTGVSGDIKRVSPVRTNALYLPYKNYTITIDSTGSGATLSLITGIANSQVRKVRSSQKSTLSSKSVIQDNYRNQQHSYVIEVEEQLSKFKDIIIDVFHPTGSKLFANHLVSRVFTATTFDVQVPSESNTSENPVRFRPAIGHFTPYIFTGTFDLRGDTYNPSLGGSPTYIDYYPTGFNGLTAATIGNAATHDPITSGFTIGAMGGPSAGTQNPEAFGVTFSVNAGVTLPGYTVENITQFIQVTGTDSVTAPFWIIYKHPKNSAIGFKTTFTQQRKEFYLDVDGPLGGGETFGYFTSFTNGISAGDILVQRSSDRRTAIGEVVRGEGQDAIRAKRSNISTKAIATGTTAAFSVTINTINGAFTNVPNSDGTRRFIENLRTGNTYDTFGTGGINFIIGTTANTGPLDWNSTVIGDFLDKTIYS